MGGLQRDVQCPQRGRSGDGRAAGEPVRDYQTFGEWVYVSMAPCSCFAPGTKVWTMTGRRPIEGIKIGDCVLAQDVESGELAYKPVLGVTIRPAANHEDPHGSGVVQHHAQPPVLGPRPRLAAMTKQLKARRASIRSRAGCRSSRSRPWRPSRWNAGGLQPDRRRFQHLFCRGAIAGPRQHAAEVYGRAVARPTARAAGNGGARRVGDPFAAEEITNIPGTHT